MASIKEIPIGSLVATTGGNLNVPTGAYTVPTTAPADNYSVYRLTGSPTLASDLDLVASGAVTTDIYIKIINESNITLSGNQVTIFGAVVPDVLATVNYSADCYYNGSAWVVFITPDWETTSVVDANRIATDAVTTAKVQDNAITLAKMAGLATGNVIIGDASGDPAAVDMSTDGEILIGDATAGATSQAITGVIALTKAGVTSFNSITKIDSKYSNTATTAVTTEETLWSNTLSAGLLASDGMGISVKVYGIVAANANAKTIRVKVDGNTVVSNGTTTAPNGLNWEAEMVVLRSGATSSVSRGMIAFNGIADEVDTNKPGVTWANAIPIAVTGQNGVASADDITVELVVLSLIK